MAANEVGTITVRGDTRGIKKITTALREMGRRSDKTEKKASKLGKTVGRLVAGASVGLFARAVIRNTIEQEQAIAQLNATLKSTGRFSDETSQALQNQAAALQKLTTFGDEQIIRAQSLLLSFRQIGSDAFPAATKATLNLATVMGTDLKSAALQVGKALEDPARQMSFLARSGISFSKAQMDLAKELQATGDIAGAQAIVLKELETQFGGSAEAARDTFGGALKAVSNAFGDLLEGDKGTISGATQALNELEETLNSPAIQQGFQKLISGIATTVGWAAQGVTAFSDFGTAIGDFFGELVHGPTIDDPAGLREQLKLLEGELERSENAWIRFDFLGAEEYEKNLRNRIQITKDQIALAKALDPGDPVLQEIDVRAIADQKIEGLTAKVELTEIELDNEKLQEHIDKLQTSLTRDLRRAGTAAGKALTTSVADTTAELAGEAAEINLEYARTLAEIDTWERALAASGQLSLEKQRELTVARENAAEATQRELDILEKERLEREAQLTPTQELIAALELEIDLMKLGAEEREREIIQRKLAGEATAEQLAEIDQLILKRQEAQDAIQQMDEVRNVTKGFLLDLTDGAGSVGDAFDNLFDRIRQRALEMIAERLIEQIFGAFGTAGGGGGGGFASLLGGLFGGGRAAGGPVSPGRVYEVHPPEMLSVGSRDFILGPPQGGTVTPAANIKTTNNRTQVVNITIPKTVPERTIAQAATRFAQIQRREQARNS
jgi:hypothetical protein